MSSDQPIKIAISGGGLAGAILANALLKHRHLDVHIFESGSTISERGAAVGLAANAQAALAEIGGVVADVIERAGGVTMTSSRLCMASGASALSVVHDLAAEQRGKAVHRAALLAELLKPIDESRKHTNKKVVRIEDPNSYKDQVTVYFDDGTVFHADAVVGADGVRGSVRGHVLGKEHPSVPAKPAGFWDVTSVISRQKAEELLGEDYFKVDRMYGWIGDGGFFMHNVIDGGERVQCVLSAVMSEGEEWTGDEWSKRIDRTALEMVLDKWMDTPLKEGIIQTILQNPEPKAFLHQHHGVDAPTYAKGRACIMGDAAHSMTPWQGSGAGQAIEDAMILDTLLEQIKMPSQLPAAFQAYDQIRRPRTQKIVHSSHGTGLIMCGRSTARLDIAQIQETLPGRWGFIFGHSQSKHKQAALAALKTLL